MTSSSGITRPVHPRLRGGLGEPVRHMTATLGSSPLTRGFGSTVLTDGRFQRFIPAYAGVWCWRALACVCVWVHPRLRGGLCTGPDEPKVLVGSSPLTRGFGPLSFTAAAAHGFIPAYAGVCSESSAAHGFESVHPRLRGGLILLDRWCATFPGSSPLTRGFDEIEIKRFNITRFIPAYAGVCLTYPCGYARFPVHPRLRGGLSTMISRAPSCAGSSPLTRGFGSCSTAWAGPSGFIPAYAGVCLCDRECIVAYSVHPRLRGGLHRL